MTNWKKYKFSDIIDIIGGGTPKTNKVVYWNGGIPWLSVVDFSDVNKYVYFTKKSITQLGLMESATKILSKGSIIISARGTVGKIAVLGSDMAFNQTCYGLIANDKTTNNYLYYLLKYKLNQFKNHSHGSVFNTIIKNTFSEIEVSLPPLPTQNHIAEILGALDDKIELNLQMNKTLKEMAMVLYKHWFVDFRPLKDGEFVESKLGPVPKGWKVEKIKDFGKVVCGKTPSKKIPQNFNGNIPFIKIPDMNRQVWVIRTTDSLSEIGHLSQPKKMIPAGSVCVSCIATVGLVSLTPYNSHTNQQINSIIPYETEDKYYLYLACNELKDIFLKEASGGSATLNMNTCTFNNINLLKPNEEIRRKFSLEVKDNFDQILNNLEENQTLTQTRDYLLPKLISGEIEVKAAKEKIKKSFKT